jgi:hypothetical protein
VTGFHDYGAQSSPAISTDFRRRSSRNENSVSSHDFVEQGAGPLGRTSVQAGVDTFAIRGLMKTDFTKKILGP